MWVMENCKCPNCRARHVHPVRIEDKPRVDSFATVNHPTVYRVCCHACTVKGLSDATVQQYNVIHERIVATATANTAALHKKRKRAGR